ncbi:hypothetical protein [Acidovorax temperans]|uniref:hypothetical protein n=1 Tax=Acidovorax temperans TaxID=80878 RepID=UPI0012EE2AB9|nr:hypothetical protein [Acidovorax temperans]
MTSNLPGQPQRLAPPATSPAKPHGPAGLAAAWGCGVALAPALAWVLRGVHTA